MAVTILKILISISKNFDINDQSSRFFAHIVTIATTLDMVVTILKISISI